MFFQKTLKKCFQSQLRFSPLARFSSQAEARLRVKDIVHDESHVGQRVSLLGWVKSVRKQKEMVFVDVNDGSCLKNLQIVSGVGAAAESCTLGSSVRVSGTLRKSSHPQQKVELFLEKCEIVGKCDSFEYPFKTKTRHSDDYVRQFLHLRARTNTGACVLRVRNAVSMLVHQYFQEKDFLFVHTPLLTTNDCEGAGETFTVAPKHYFKQPAHLTVSGQLHLECAVSGMSRVYNFGPVFRAEKSISRHHLAEFYMVEAELIDTNSLDDVIRLVDDLVRFVITAAMDRCSEDLAFLHKQASPSHDGVVRGLLQRPSVRLSYQEACDILQKHPHPVKYGDDLKKDHEKFLVQHCGGAAVFVTDFPVHLKPFYMRTNEGGRTAAAVDLLFPLVGELVGGSLREERLQVLQERLTAAGLVDSLQWYLELRKFGTLPHGGFGLGFDRLIQFVTGMATIRDTIPFPRYVYSCSL